MWPSVGWVGVLLLVSACSTTPPGVRPGPGVPPDEPFAAGLAALAERRYDQAARHLTETARRYPPLEDYALLFEARAAARAGRPADALVAAERLRNQYPDSIWADEATLLTGEVLRAHGDSTEARAWLFAARTAALAGTPTWTRASLDAAEVARTQGDGAVALGLALDVRRNRPGRVAARRARRLVERLRAGGLVAQPGERVEEAELRLRERDLAGARAEATAALAEHLAPEPRARALWVRAQVEHALREPAAEATCREIADELPEEPLAPRALLTAAGWRWNADDDTGALDLFREVVRRFPASPQAAEALYGMGRIYQEEGRRDPRRYADAVAAYSQLANTYPHAPLAAEARWRAGWARYLAGEFALAEESFRTLARHGAGSTRAAAEYWRARALAQLRRDTEAHARLLHLADQHPTSYYADLAEERLGRPSATVDPPPAVAPPRFPDDLTGPHAERARTLALLGFPGYARLELAAMPVPGTPTPALLEAYRAVGAPGAALRVARGIEPGPEGALGPYLYPLGYWDTVRAAAGARSLDPLLVTALIRQESLFDPDAVSPADAHGLMQLLPSTARELTRGASLPPSAAALHDPATNIDLGTTLLARLRDQYGGSLPKALAAYNAGADAVAKWERRYGSRPADEFVELISYRETRDYVKTVLGNYRLYRRLYARRLYADAPAANPSARSFGSPPNAPFDMTTMTSPGRADASR